MILRIPCSTFLRPWTSQRILGNLFGKGPGCQDCGCLTLSSQRIMIFVGWHSFFQKKYYIFLKGGRKKNSKEKKNSGWKKDGRDGVLKKKKQSPFAPPKNWQLTTHRPGLEDGSQGFLSQSRQGLLHDA